MTVIIKMRFIIVSAANPCDKREIDIPDKIVKKISHSSKVKPVKKTAIKKPAKNLVINPLKKRAKKKHQVSRSLIYG